MSFEDSMIYRNEQPSTLYEKLLTVKDLLCSKSRLEFRLIWRRLFQTDDQEIEWLLDPSRPKNEANLLKSFNRNYQAGYQYSYDYVKAQYGQEKVTIYNKSVAKPNSKPAKKQSSFKQSALSIARYMGMGVYMTSSAFPSPFVPFSEQTIFDATIEGRNVWNEANAIYC